MDGLKNEELTRILIDQQLVHAGWKADSQELTWHAFNEAPLEQNHTLSSIYHIELGDMAAEAETRIQVATVQSMAIMAENSPYFLFHGNHR